ncbi:MAG: hypothetical protein ACRES8_07255 [Nevskiaceae bacterium]
MPKGHLVASLLGMALCAGTAAAAENTLTFRGYAYDLASGKFLYTEVHKQVIEQDRWLGGTIDYYGPDGARIGHKTLDFGQDPYVPVYRLDLSTGGGYMEGITALGADRIDMQKKGYGSSQVRKASVPRRGTMVADSGFHSFLRDRFADLVAGKTVEFTFAVSGELDTFRFRARRIADREFEGKPAVQLKVDPSTLLRLLADPLYILYEPSQRRMLEYRGISNLHDPATRKAYKVRIVYPSVPPADAPALPEDA